MSLTFSISVLPPGGVNIVSQRRLPSVKSYAVTFPSSNPHITAFDMTTGADVPLRLSLGTSWVEVQLTLPSMVE